MSILCIFSFVRHITIAITAKNNEKITRPLAIQKSQYAFVMNTMNIVNNISNNMLIIDIPNAHVPNEITIIERRRTIFAKTQSSIFILYNISYIICYPIPNEVEYSTYETDAQRYFISTPLRFCSLLLRLRRSSQKTTLLEINHKLYLNTI
jgi:hypothetical protein